MRTGFIYGVAERTTTEEQRGTVWSTSEAIDSARREAETESFQNLVGELEKVWGTMLQAHARSGT